MISVSDAQAIVLEKTERREAVPLPTLGSRYGFVLAEDIAADLDSPPFDKSMMDGYAIRFEDWKGSLVQFKIVGEIAAGQLSQHEIGVGEAVRIFTGAPVPPGATAVVKQEDTRVESGQLSIPSPVTLGQNIIRRGEEMAKGQVVLKAGMALSPVVQGLLAGLGRTEVLMNPGICVDILVTGNEIVKPSEVPTGGQIRNTNGPMLRTLSERCGGVTVQRAIVGDDRELMKKQILKALEEVEIVVLTGGVSVGDYDHVPEVLKSLNVQIHFHKVRMKPGKPLLFGTLGNQLIFGLPGNPVSALVGFELFVRPAIRKMIGLTPAIPTPFERKITAPLKANHDRPTYHPAKLSLDGVEPLEWRGSANLLSFAHADALLVLPPGEIDWAIGHSASVIPLTV